VGLFFYTYRRTGGADVRGYTKLARRSANPAGFAAGTNFSALIRKLFQDFIFEQQGGFRALLFTFAKTVLVTL
jgi:hypothetical protein